MLLEKIGNGYTVEWWLSFCFSITLNSHFVVFIVAAVNVLTQMEPSFCKLVRSGVLEALKPFLARKLSEKE